MLDVGILQSVKSLEVIMIITQDKFAESVESCFRQDWSIHYSQQQQQQQQKAPPPPQQQQPSGQRLDINSDTSILMTHTYVDDRPIMKIPVVVKVLPTCKACTLAIGRIVEKS